MRIKHWQGYGTVNAVKSKMQRTQNGRVLTVTVSGNHEWGLVRNDKSDIFNWLVKRFDKTATSCRDILAYEITTVAYAPVETVQYRITLRDEQ